MHQRAEGLACDVPESGGQHDVAEIAVAELSDVLRERLPRGEPHDLLSRGCFLPERLPPGEAGRMCEDVPQRDPVLVAAAEVGNELAKRHVEFELSLAHEREDQSGRGELGERGKIEERRCRARAVGSGAWIGTQRASRIRVDRAAALDAHDRGGAERADRIVDDRFRARDEVGHAKSRMPAPMLKNPGTTAGSEPDGVRSPSRTSAAAMRLGSRES